MPTSAGRDKQAGVLGVVVDEEVAVARVGVPADLALCEWARGNGDGGVDGTQEVAQIALAFFGNGLGGVVDCGPGKRGCDCLVGVVGLGVWDSGWVDVAVAVASYFEELVRGRDDEETVGEIENCWVLAQSLLLGVGDGHVANDLAGCFADASQIDEGGCPGASRQDGQISSELRIVAQADTRDGVCVVIDKDLLHTIDDEVDAVHLLDLLAQPDHGTLSVGPARAPVHVACAAIAPGVIALETCSSANLLGRVCNLNPICSNPAHVVQRCLDVLLLFTPSCQTKTSLVVLFCGKVGAPAVLCNVREAIVGCRGVVRTDDTGSVNLEVMRSVWLPNWDGLRSGVAIALESNVR